MINIQPNWLLYFQISNIDESIFESWDNTDVFMCLTHVCVCVLAQTTNSKMRTDSICNTRNTKLMTLENWQKRG